MCMYRLSKSTSNTNGKHHFFALGITRWTYNCRSYFPVCDSNDCSHRASRRANKYRMNTTAAVPEIADTEMEMCNNCKVTKFVSVDGRMKRCSRCKAKLYCSKECQIQDWKNGHKHYCKSVTDE